MGYFVNLDNNNVNKLKNIFSIYKVDSISKLMQFSHLFF
jgi:hypothetical protein